MLTPEEKVEYAYLTHASLDEGVRQLRTLLLEIPPALVTHDGKHIVVFYKGLSTMVDPMYGVTLGDWRTLVIDIMTRINRQLEFSSDDRLRLRSYRPT